jgi:5-methylcytosine-specific restriction endonuclease McrA
MAATRSDANSTEKETYALGFAPNGVSVCVLCNEECNRDAAPTDPNAFQLGHVVSDANGGRFEWDNLAPMCRACNVWLGKRDTDASKFHYNPWERYSLPAPAAAKASIVARGQARHEALSRKEAARL